MADCSLRASLEFSSFAARSSLERRFAGVRPLLVHSQAWFSCLSEDVIAALVNNGHGSLAVPALDPVAAAIASMGGNLSLSVL